MLLESLKTRFYSPTFLGLLTLISLIFQPSFQTISTLLIILFFAISTYIILRRNLKFSAFFLSNILLIFLIIPPGTNPLFVSLITILTTIIHKYSKKEEKYYVFPVIPAFLISTGIFWLINGHLLPAEYWFLPSKNSLILTLIIIYAVTNVTLWFRYIILLTFLLTHFGLLLLQEIPLSEIAIIFETPAFYFFLIILLIEPKTTPTNPVLQGVFGVFAAIIYNLLWHFNIPYPDFLTILSAGIFYQIKLQIGKSNKALHFFKKIGGILMIIIGIIGWLIPVIPGWPLLIPGIILVAPEYGEKVKSWFEKRRKRS